MTADELLEKLRSFSPEEFKEFRYQFGGDGPDPEWYVRRFLREPEKEPIWANFLKIPTEKEKEMVAAMSAAGSAKRSATAAEQSVAASERAAKATEESAGHAKRAADAAEASASHASGANRTALLAIFVAVGLGVISSIISLVAIFKK